MRRKNKFIEDSNISKEESQNLNESDKNNSTSFRSTKKENIINDLKLKGFNKVQIDDILETLIRNSVNDKSPLFEDKNPLNIQKTKTIDSEIPSNIKIGINKNISQKDENINNNSKYKNSIIIKTESVEILNVNKNKSNQNCVKLYINASSEKNREYFSNSFENKEDDKNNGKKLSIKKCRNMPQLVKTLNNSNILYSKKINPKIGNYIKKFSSLYMNRKGENKDEILQKLENEINNKYKNQRNVLYNNYNFKMIFDSKKIKDSMDNIGYFEIKNHTSREGYGASIKSRNILNEEDKNNNSNSFSIKQKILSATNKVSLDLNEIIEEKENNEANKDNEAKDNYIDNVLNINDESEKLNKKINKTKFNTTKKKEIKVNKEKKFIKECINSKYIAAKKIFSGINSNKKETNSHNNKKNNVFMIRKQRTEEEEKLAKKNIAIIEIKHNESKNNEDKNNKNNDKDIENNKKKLYRNNGFINYEKSNKSKSFSKLNNIEKDNNSTKNFIIDENLKRSLSNYNHSFVNINLCKNKYKNSSTFYKLRGLTNKENSCSTFRNNLKGNGIIDKLDLNLKHSFEDINLKNKDKEKDMIYNKINRVHSFINTDLISFNRLNHIMLTSYNLKCKKKNDEEDLNNNSNINDNININNSKKYKNIKTEDNLNVYIKQKKNYQNGIYEGIMLDDKREIKGIMMYSNGARYEGQWRNDKKNGKGIFTSSHYYNCKKVVGMKYEGEFKDDKFDGYGVTTYTNGDKYEGEWKNNKQYGKGIVTYCDGSKYDGEWVNGKFEGIGIFYLKNGEKYEGRFADNKYNGYGKYYYNNGNYLEGIFKNDHPRGNCILHKSDGTTINVHH